MNLRVLLPLFAATTCAFADPPEPRFRAVTIDDKVQIGYGVAVADVDGDKLPDILLADKKQFVWYKNPGAEKSGDPAAWQKFVIAENLTKHDNVCLAAEDIDGDGKCELAVGAEWNPGDTENSGAVFYMIPPADRTQRWEPVKLHAEPTTHRMRWLQYERGGRWGLVVLPLHGRGNKNGEGAGVRVLLYQPPEALSDPKGEWKTELADESMHMTHNFRTVKRGVLIAGKEGLHYVFRENGKWNKIIEFGAVLMSERGAGEVCFDEISLNMTFVAAIEPMHGNELVVYTVSRRVLTDKLVEGHALAAENGQIVVGWRGKAGAPESTIGVAVWTPLDDKGENWRETIIDRDGMACEDLQLADLNGDGKRDIIASGRATKNLKVYFNEAAP